MSEAVISGIGVVSPLGVGSAAFWDALCAGRTAISRIRRFDPGTMPPCSAAEVGEIPARDVLPAALVRRMDRVSQMIGVAAVLAARDAGLAPGPASDELGVVVGSALGNLSESAQFLERVFTKGPSLANPMLFPNLVMNAPASQVAMALGWRGPNLTVSAGEISAESALDAALGLLRRYRARAVVVAAGEELSAPVFRALREFRLLSPRGGGPERSSPFDVDANGPVVGEGASAIVVETAESARRRGATVHATIERVIRFQLAAKNPHAWPAAQVARDARDLPVVPADLVFSGADSSPERDRIELSLLARMVPRTTPVYSLAGAVGSHAAQGLTTLSAAVLALSSGRLPPVVGLERPCPDVPFVFPKQVLRGSWTTGLVLGVARGGAGVAIPIVRGERGL
jgi:3-oxoacyl-[acyl-carrier-protein] synthase II